MQPEGYYRRSDKAITNWYTEKSRNNNWQLVLEVQVNEFNPNTPANDDEGGWEQLDRPIKRRVFLNLSKAWLTRSIADIKSLGYPQNEKLDITRLVPGGPESIDFSLASRTVFQCEHDSYTDKTTDKVKDVERWTVCRKKGGTVPSREDADQLNQMFAEAEEKAPF